MLVGVGERTRKYLLKCKASMYIRLAGPSDSLPFPSLITHRRSPTRGGTMSWSATAGTRGSGCVID